jgi:hypothetical protein
MMQEHRSMSASQPASHVSAHAFNAKREAQPHLNLKLNVINVLGW